MKKRTELTGVAKLADIALKNRLYVSGWSLSEELKYIRDNPKNYMVRLKYEDSIPVCVVTKNKVTGQMMAFTKKAYRRKGYASRLILSMKSGKSYGGYGITANIWRVTGVTVK